jgi:cellulose synthase/poly-beta-1,6-N-acetylglucosamine synthase-like glycosyltransferase
VTGLLVAVTIASLVYFAATNTLYAVFTAISWRSVNGHLRARRHSAIDEAFASPLTPPISVLVPAYNEEAVIVESVRSLLALRYPAFEVVVVDDGSTDGTLARLYEAFDLVPVRRAQRDAVRSLPVRTAYVSRRNPALVVLAKENGGKADALNAGLNAARHPYVCAVDADALIEEDALLRVAKPILDDPELVIATGGIVRVANGCEIDHGRVARVGLPKSRLATLQTVEYLRAFLVGRVGWSRANLLLIVSGAFGLFRRELVEAVGGYSRATVGEDVDLVVRLHRHMRERGEPYRIEFVPDPVCWTEAPEDLRGLSGQRRRWQRGLVEALWNHRRAFANPRYGALGLVALPYFALFEVLGPFLALAGPPLTLLAWLAGAVSPTYVVAFFAVSVLLGLLLSVAALVLEELSFRRQTSGRELARLLAYTLGEHFGYRQLNDFWRLEGLVDVLRGRRGWGELRRRGFLAVPAAAPDAAVVPAPAAAPAVSHQAVTVDRLARLVHERGTALSDRASEWRYTLVYLRGYAGLDGRLPNSFDSLVDEVFGELFDQLPVAA